MLCVFTPSYTFRCEVGLVVEPNMSDLFQYASYCSDYASIERPFNMAEMSFVTSPQISNGLRLISPTACTPLAARRHAIFVLEMRSHKSHDAGRFLQSKWIAKRGSVW